MPTQLICSNKNSLFVTYYVWLQKETMPLSVTYYRQLQKKQCVTQLLLVSSLPITAATQNKWIDQCTTIIKLA